MKVEQVFSSYDYKHYRNLNGFKYCPECGSKCLPCGFIEFDEDFLTAAIREVKEETNLDIQINSILNVAFNFLSPNIHTLVIVLLAEKIGGELCARDDLNDLDWFNVNNTLPEMAFDADEYIIKRYFGTKMTGLPIDLEYAFKR